MDSKIFQDFVKNLDRPLAFVDVETTGLDYKSERIVELAIVKYSPNLSISRFNEMFNPGIPIRPEAKLVNEIDETTLVNKPTFKQRSRHIYKFVNDCDFAGANVGFDLSFLKHELRRSGINVHFDNCNKVDVLGIWKNMEPRSLQRAKKIFTGEEADESHRAMPDIASTISVLCSQMEKYDLPRRVDLLSKMSARVEDLSIEVLHKRVNSLTAEVSSMKAKDLQFKFDLALELAKTEQDFYKYLNKFGIDYRCVGDELRLSSENTTAIANSMHLLRANFSFQFLQDAHKSRGREV
ncbi:MAG: 3'-5' exonuclease [Cyclobacteriaceae bacterium]